MKIRLLLSITLLLVAAGLAYWRWTLPAPLGETDLLLVGDIANKTGDANFDGALREALRVSLQQSPFLNLVSDEKARATLTALGKSADTAIAPEIAKEICERAGAKAFLTGEAAKTNSNYTLNLEVRRCPGGDRLAHATGEAVRVDQLVHQLGVASSDLRAKLGERYIDPKTRMEEESCECG